MEVPGGCQGGALATKAFQHKAYNHRQPHSACTLIVGANQWRLRIVKAMVKGTLK